MSDNKYRTDEIDWAEFQKKYFDALMSFNPSSSPFKSHNPLENSFLNNAMDHWWKSMRPTPSMENEALFEKIFEQSKNYYYMGEQFSSLIEGLSNFNNKRDVTRFINQKFKEFETLFSDVPTEFSWSSFVDACEVPYEQMKNNSASGMFNFASMLGDFNPEIRKFRDQFLSVPGLGYSRELQDKLQKLIKLGAIYQDNYNEYQSQMSHLNRDALELMRKKILRMSKKGDDFNSMRQVYDLWIESNEKVYGDYAHSNEYSELNGKLVNSQMAFMKLSHEVNEDVLKAMNLPTTSSMNELERRHYELRKKVKVLETELKNLKEQKNKKNTVKEIQEVSTKQEANVIKKKKAAKKNVAKKKTSKKKVARKKTENKVVESVKKKVARRATKSAKKKTTSRRRRNPVKSDVIEIKF